MSHSECAKQLPRVLPMVMQVTPQGRPWCSPQDSLCQTGECLLLMAETQD